MQIFVAFSDKLKFAFNSKCIGTLLVGSSESVLPLQTVIMKIMIANFAWQSSSNCLQWQLLQGTESFFFLLFFFLFFE